MSPLRILLSFAPWIVFAILSGQAPASTTIAILAALAVTIVTGYQDLAKKYVLAWVTLVFFVFSSGAVIVLKWYFLIPLLGILSMASLSLVCWITAAFGKPFTLPYALEGASPAIVASRQFLRANYVITGVWGFIFVANTLIAIAAYSIPGLHDSGLGNATWITILIGVAFTVWYPAYLQKRYSRQMGSGAE